MSVEPPNSSVRDLAHKILSDVPKIEEGNLRGKRVLVRVDFNVPVRDAVVDDWTRVDSALPTIRTLTEQGARVVLLSHFGRPKPKQMSLDKMRALFSLALLAPKLRDELGTNFKGVTGNSVGSEAVQAIHALRDSEVLLLENIRFEPGEEANDLQFAKMLAEPFDAYVNDAFGVCHRAQASVSAVARVIPECYIGLLMRKELTFLLKAMEYPQRPFVVIIGGAKVADKIGVLTELVKLADKVLIGGRMAYTFLASRGIAIGKTHVEHASFDFAQGILQAARARGTQLLLPVDVVNTYDLDGDQSCCTLPLNTTCCTVDSPCVPNTAFGADIGPGSGKLFVEALQGAQTIFWNGPMGRYENPAFSNGTTTVARGVAAATGAGAVTIVGGGDTVSAVKALQLEDSISHCSTGGGAGLAFVEGKQLPGLEAMLLSP